MFVSDLEPKILQVAKQGIYGIFKFSVLTLRYNSCCTIRDLKISGIQASPKADSESFMEPQYGFSTKEKKSYRKRLI